MIFLDFESEHDMNTIVYDSQKIELSGIEKYLSWKISTVFTKDELK